MLAGTKAYAAAVKDWSPRERKFIPRADKFYNGSEYLMDPAEWEREPTPYSGPVFKSKGDGLTAVERARKQRDEAMREAGLLS